MVDGVLSLPPVIDASPLIFLTKADRLNFLQFFYPEVFVPKAVATQIQQYGEADITFQALVQTRWLVILETQAVPQMIQDCNLDPGESEVLTWA